MTTTIAPINDLRWMADSYKQIQHLRIILGNQLKARQRGADTSPEPSTVRGLHDMLKDAEGIFVEDFKVALEGHPAMRWLGEVLGLGPILCGKLLAEIDISRADTISALWRFAGFGVVDGERERPKAAMCPVCGARGRRKAHHCPVDGETRQIKGERLAYNAGLKTAVYLVTGSFMKCGSPYRARMYDPSRLRYILRATSWSEAEAQSFVIRHRAAEEGPARRATEQEFEAARLPGSWTLGHIHAASLRKMAKLFLSHLWLTWREAEGLPVRSPYVEEYQGHTHIIDPWDMVAGE